MPLYVVGGFVRDGLLKKTCKDIDILTLGDSASLAHAFAEAQGGAKVTIFKNFGTAMVHWGPYVVEFVQARKESYQVNSRKPKVLAGTLEDDIFRRDFTVNTLAISLNQADLGRLVDLCDGMTHLKKGIIHTPCDPRKTFSDDPLRMFRAVRFATQLHFRLAPAVVTAIQEEAGRISILSKERIIEEVNKILLSPDPVRGLRLLDHLGLLKRILPEMEALKGVKTINGLSHKENFIHTLKVVENVLQLLKGKKNPMRLWLIWAALLHDIAKPITKRFIPSIGFTFHNHEWIGAKMVPKIFKRLGLPLRAEMRYVKKLVQMHLRHLPLVENEVSDSAVRRFIYDAGDEIEDLLLLCRADITSNNPRKIAKYLANFDKLDLMIKAIEEKDHIRNLQPVIGGHSIMKIFELKPSPIVGKLKGAIKEAILAGRIPNEYEAVYAYMVTHAKELGLKLPSS